MTVGAKPNTGDCPECLAIAPAHGNIEHAWDCSWSPHPKRFYGWYDSMPSIECTPLAPLYTLSAGEKAELMRLATMCCEAWERKSRAAAA